MTHQEILEKAINKAIDNGWKKSGLENGFTMTKTYKGLVVWQKMSSGYFDARTQSDIVFSHDFAKALWGETSDTLTVQNNSLNVKQVIDMNGWRYYLQQMVIADDPIEYLGKNIS